MPPSRGWRSDYEGIPRRGVRIDVVGGSTAVGARASRRTAVLCRMPEQVSQYLHNNFATKLNFSIQVFTKHWSSPYSLFGVVCGGREGDRERERVYVCERERERVRESVSVFVCE